MAQTKSTRTHARAAAGAAGTKRTRRTRNAAATNRGSKKQRSGEATTSTPKKGRSGAPTAPDEPTPRRSPSEYDLDSGEVESGRQPRGGRADETIDEETDARSKRPGGTGDVSFGDDDEGPEGPAR